MISFNGKQYDPVTTYELDCSNSEITKIPREFVNLTELNCNDCPQLKEIPNTLVNLKELNCNDCPQLKEIPNTLVNLKKLNCNNCPQLKEIPNTLVNLTFIFCKNCTKLTEIPNTLVNLTELKCSDCPKLKEIPNTLVNLILLKCDGCPQITCIPDELVSLVAHELPRCEEIGNSLSLNQRITKVSRNKSKINTLQWDDKLKSGYETSRGCYTENKGVLCNTIDMEDTENQVYLGEDPNNIIFIVSIQNNNIYYAYGYNKKDLAYDINTDVFYDCKRNPDGSYKTVDNNGKFGYYNLEGLAYVKINLNSFSVLVLAEELMSMIEDDKRVFLLKGPTTKFLYTSSYGVMFNHQDHISADHCQRGTDKEVYTLYVLE